ARRLAADGTRVALLARRADKVHGIAKEINEMAGAELAHGFLHDVADRNKVEPLWAVIEEKIGEVGQLYYLAGVMEEVGRDEFDTEKDARHFIVNTLGSVAWVNAAAARFQKQGAGVICGVTSVAQDRGRVRRPAYNASKAGMDTHLEAVRNRLWRKNVCVTTIRLGFVDTPLTRGVPGMFWLISADRAAELILRSVQKRKSIAYVPARWRPLMFVIRNIPSVIFRRLNV
ncbi:MAG: SDR family NAD(P)-dependent oxidoreductase, partial [Acidobacteria bacterium]|nr:SDR family NAD(P)-dependent oxidoreductase [Acidobacteriota bacterium]